MLSPHLFIILSAVYSTYAWPSPHSIRRSSHKALLTSSRKSTHHKRGADSPGGIVETFHPAAVLDTFGDGFQLDLPTNAARDDGSALVKVVTGFLQSHLNLTQGTFESTQHAEGEIVTNVYFKQMINGIYVVNTRANVAVTKSNKLVSAASSFREPSSISATTPTLTVDKAFAAAEKHLGGTRAADVPAELKYYLNEAHAAILIHTVRIRTPDRQHEYQVYVDATTGEVVGLIDFVSHAVYRGVRLPKKDPTQGLDIISDPQDPNASPKGWHSDTSDTGIRTSGNNALLFLRADESTTQGPSSPGKQFFFPFDDRLGVNDPNNIASAKVNAFYVINSMHDISYVYGFDEKHWNFQVDNFGKGGNGNDPVKGFLHDASGVDNSRFTTRPDGEPGDMLLFMWDKTNPGHDGGMENDLIVHEYTHGITQRLSGAGGVGCLDTTEASGMGEGWSDAMAFWASQSDATVKDFTMADYVFGGSIRQHPYSQSKDRNPLMYHNVAVLIEPHALGEIWANILINVYWDLVAKHGFSSTAHKDPSGTAGNVVWMHLFIDGLQLQPCGPTFLTARDSWILADHNRYGGQHSCVLWNSFASRGLGFNAGNFVDDHTVPGGPNCDSGVPTTIVGPTKTSTLPTGSPTPTTTKLPPAESHAPDGCLVWWPFCMDV